MIVFAYYWPDLFEGTPPVASNTALVFIAGDLSIPYSFREPDMISETCLGGCTLQRHELNSTSLSQISLVTYDSRQKSVSALTLPTTISIQPTMTFVKTPLSITLGQNSAKFRQPSRSFFARRRPALLRGLRVL